MPDAATTQINWVRNANGGALYWLVDNYRIHVTKQDQVYQAIAIRDHYDPNHHSKIKGEHKFTVRDALRSVIGNICGTNWELPKGAPQLDDTTVQVHR